MSEPYYSDDLVTLYHGDCRDVLAGMPDASVDAVVTDPPYELGFMGKGWDSTGIAYDVSMWREVRRVLKPGGHVLAFGASRTWHRLAAAIEDAGSSLKWKPRAASGAGQPRAYDSSKGQAEQMYGGQEDVWASQNGPTDDSNPPF